MNKRGGPRTERSEQRRTEILDSAARLFADRGYEAASIADIAEDLDATKGLIYHHFRGKEHILFGVLMAGLQSILDRAELIAEDEQLTASDRLFAMARAHALITMREYTYQRTAFRTLNEYLYSTSNRSPAWDEISVLRRNYERLYVDLIAEVLMQSGRSRDQAPLLARGMLGALNWLNVWYRAPGERDSGGRQSPEEIADALAAYTVGGLASS